MVADIIEGYTSFDVDFVCFFVQCKLVRSGGEQEKYKAICTHTHAQKKNKSVYITQYVMAIYIAGSRGPSVQFLFIERKCKDSTRP